MNMDIEKNEFDSEFSNVKTQSKLKVMRQYEVNI